VYDLCCSWIHRKFNFSSSVEPYTGKLFSSSLTLRFLVPPFVKWPTTWVKRSGPKATPLLHPAWINYCRYHHWYMYQAGTWKLVQCHQLCTSSDVNSQFTQYWQHTITRLMWLGGNKRTIKNEDVTLKTAVRWVA